MRYMCVKCRTVFTAAWQPEYVKFCPACQPKTQPRAGSKPPAKPNRKRSEKAPPSTAEEVT